MKIPASFVFAFLLFFSPALNAQDRAAMSETQARNLWMSVGAEVFAGPVGGFERLNKKLQMAREGDIRTPSGTHALWWVHRGFDRIFYVDLDQPENTARMMQVLDDWIAHSPSEPTPYILKAEMYMDLSTRLDHDGYQGTKSKELFVAAEQWLLDHKDVASKSPFWYSAMTRAVTHKLDKQLVLDVFEEGSKAFPHYLTIYVNAFQALLWLPGGNEEDVEYVARRALDLTHEQEGLSMYTRVYWSVFGGRDSFDFDIAANWEDIKTGMRDILKQYPGQWNAQFFAYLSCYQQDYRMASEMFKVMDRHLIRQGYGLDMLRMCRDTVEMLEKDNLPFPGETPPLPNT